MTYAFKRIGLNFLRFPTKIVKGMHDSAAEYHHLGALFNLMHLILAFR